VFATAPAGRRDPQRRNFAWEWWYRFQVTDNIFGDPSALHPQPPLGFRTTPSGEELPQLGGLVKKPPSVLIARVLTMKFGLGNDRINLRGRPFPPTFHNQIPPKPVQRGTALEANRESAVRIGSAVPPTVIGLFSSR